MGKLPRKRAGLNGLRPAVLTHWTRCSGKMVLLRRICRNVVRCGVRCLPRGQRALDRETIAAPTNHWRRSPQGLVDASHRQQQSIAFPESSRTRCAVCCSPFFPLFTQTALRQPPAATRQSPAGTGAYAAMRLKMQFGFLFYIVPFPFCVLGEEFPVGTARTCWLGAGSMEKEILLSAVLEEFRISFSGCANSLIHVLKSYHSIHPSLRRGRVGLTTPAQWQARHIPPKTMLIQSTQLVRLRLH